MITPIQPITTIRPTEGTGAAAKTSGAAVPFADVFQSAIQNVQEASAEKDQVQYLLATGQLDNPALSAIASSKYQTSVDILVQIRNKALDAYSELTRINL